MIRLGNNIRLSAGERATLATLVGAPVNPRTVAEHDALLARAQSAFAAGPDAGLEEVAESRLMGAVLERMRLEA
jgi:hypothetical protein